MKICDLNDFDTNKIVFETEEFMDENNEMVICINFKLSNPYQFGIYKHPKFDEHEFSCSIPSQIVIKKLIKIFDYCTSQRYIKKN